MFFKSFPAFRERESEREREREKRESGRGTEREGEREREREREKQRRRGRVFAHDAHVRLLHPDADDQDVSGLGFFGAQALSDGHCHRAHR